MANSGAPYFQFYHPQMPIVQTQDCILMLKLQLTLQIIPIYTE
ncbi:MAG: hypothetical protein UW51_C0013G0009 [Candidatus Amesbacteria bacterium GW2011_GWA1_44_24]|nr:MAG: hypothetical protein UW51_C0013G0009 [Candidatus Amesbacteria bacterium GW2011_GWA1_44_24]